MIQRIRQFCRAATASLDQADRNFISINLNEAQQQLFFAMNVFDQRHVLNTAYTAQHICDAEHIALDKSLLIRACLLHDIARTGEDICIWDKVANVLLAHFAPQKAKAIARAAVSLKDRHRNFLERRWYAVYIYYHHAQLGAAKLRSLGMDDIAAVIEHHHDEEKHGDSPELRVLRRADSLN